MDLSRYSHLESQTFDHPLSAFDLALLSRAPAAPGPSAGQAGLAQPRDYESAAFGGVLAALFVMVSAGSFSALTAPPAHQAVAVVQPAPATKVQPLQALLAVAPRAARLG